MLESLFNKEVPTQVFSCENCKIFKNTYFEEHLRRTASGTTSVCSGAVLFELSCRSISRKSLSLIKIENNLLLFLSNIRSSHQRLTVQNRSFGKFSKALETVCDRVCF